MRFIGTRNTLAAFGVGAVLISRALRRRRALDFRGKSVLITGASRGLGLVLARELAAEGARLTLLARNADDLERARQDIAARGAQVQIIPCDVRDRDAAREAVTQTVAHYGAIDVLVNNAGIIQAGPLDNMQIEDFEDAMATHMWGPLYLMLAAMPHMRRQGGGRIVNVASIGGKISVPHLLPYSASKFALVGLSDGMRAELAQDNILVTTVCPGLMRTGSPYNALFKGQHQAEFAWFNILDSLVVSSIDARRAARQIVEACRYGDAELVISMQAQLATRLVPLFPESVATMMAALTRFLPGPAGAEGDVARTGWESRSAVAPSILTSATDQAAAENNELKGRSSTREPQA